MDELPPIRNLSLTQQRVRDALKNAPPLTINRRSKDDFVVFDKQNKQNGNSLFDRFLKHNPIANKKSSESNDPKKSDYKWSQLKDIMSEELETKRMESQKFKEISEKMENEELDGIEDELVLNLDEDKQQNNDNEKGSVSKPNDTSSDVSDEEQEDDNESAEEEECSDEEKGEDLMNSEEEEEEDEKSDNVSNPFINDEAEDDEEERDRGIDHRSDSDSSDSFDINNHQKSLPFVEKECNEDNGLNSNNMDTSFNVCDESFEGRKCATQKIALSPFITQKLKPRFDSNNHFSELVSDLNNEEFNSQSLLDLCSGNFMENNEQNSHKKADEVPNRQIICSDDEHIENDLNSEEEEEDNEFLNQSKRVSKNFNIESDNESEFEDKETEVKTKDSKKSLKNFNESDGEELVVTDEEEEEVQQSENDENHGQHNVNAFFDDEAELSGSDEVSSDEEDNEDETQEEEGDKDELPSDSEMEEQNKKYFNKQILDEEKRNILLWKERLFEDGDLHDDGRQREKKFRWNLGTDNNFVNDYINEDSDDNYLESDEDEKTETPTLKLFDHNSNVENKTDNNLEKLELNFKRKFDLKNTNKNIGSEANNNSISAFVVRDERLKTIMSFQTKRSLNSKSFKSNKKFKSSKKSSKTSIFDLLNPIN